MRKIIRHGTAYQREQVVWKLRAEWLAAPETDPSAVRWTTILKRHLSFDAALAAAGTDRLTGEDMNDILELYSLMLETALSPAERGLLSAFAIEGFKHDPASFATAQPDVHKALTLYMVDTQLEREQWRVRAWDALLKNAVNDPHAGELLKLLAQDPSVTSSPPPTP
jgi:mannose/cellobiose epimerase-like protein (N-acyl-D-glucosamine 2-epimerase family)